MPYLRGATSWISSVVLSWKRLCLPVLRLDFLEKAIAYIPNRGRPRGANQSKRNAPMPKVRGKPGTGVLEQAKQTLRQLPCMKTQNVCEMLGQMTNPDAEVKSLQPMFCDS